MGSLWGHWLKKDKKRRMSIGTQKRKNTNGRRKLKRDKGVITEIEGSWPSV